MPDPMNAHLASRTRTHSSDGAGANDLRVATNSVDATVAAAAVGNFTSGTDEYLCYVSSDRLIRVTLDGTPPSATHGMYVAAGSTAMFYCIQAVVNAVRVYNTEASSASVTVQFLRRV